MKYATALLRSLLRVACASLALASVPFMGARAADHGDGPVASNDESADIADVFFFIDPNDPTKAVIIATLRGFIVPSEAGNFGIFDPGVRFRFEFENTGDAIPDKFFDVSFGKRTTTASGQTATILLPGRAPITALATNPTLNPTPPVPIVTDLGGGVSFFAGEMDDPFFFDIPGFNRFVASVLAGAPDPTKLDRGRNSFAGYNLMAIAFRVPVTMIKGAGNVVGVDFLTQRFTDVVTYNRGSPLPPVRTYFNIDRMGNPAINVALIPFAKKDAYNAANTQQDAAGKFAPDIIATLTALGTNSANINALAGVAVTHGDFVHLDVSIHNAGPGGGNNTGSGFPNGRRLQDDVIDTELFIITNGIITAGDHVNANDVPFTNTFPFLAPAQQPREGAGNVDDNTRN